MKHRTARAIAIGLLVVAITGTPARPLGLRSIGLRLILSVGWTLP